MPIAAAKPLARIDRQTTATRVERVLRDAILRGEYAPGEKLPAERELSTTLGVTRVTLRSALARLSAAGLVATVQGDGHRVRDVRRAGGLDRIPEMVAAFEGEPERVVKLARDLLALRRLVMSESAAECAKLGAAKLEPLRTLVEAMQACVDDRGRFAALDFEFGRTIVALANNLAFKLTFNTMVALVEENDALMEVFYDERETLLQGVRSLLVVLELGDAELARTAVRTALEALDEAHLCTIRETLTDGRGAGTRARRATKKPKPRNER